jgi:ComF family protein
VRATELGRSLFDLLLPRGCVACGGWIPDARTSSLVCDRCRSRLPRAPWPRCARCHHPLGTGRRAEDTCRECRTWPEVLRGARYAYVLDAPADDLVHALKYEGWRELAEEMGRDMARVPLPADARKASLVIPVPTTATRLRRRGYNQAELLARSMAGGLDLPLATVLERTRGGPTQVALHPSQRRANVKGAFAVRRGMTSCLRGAHVLLVDDVLTTGSTAGAAATELARAGASGVTLVTFARALPRYRTSPV